MKKMALAGLMALALAGAPAIAQTAVDFPKLKGLAEGLGYTPKMVNDKAGEEKFEVNLSTANFNVPVGLELSKSTRYVWATANLGDAGHVNGERAIALLKKNAQIQPSNFYISASGKIMIALAIDNRELTPAHLKYVLEKLAGDIDANGALWQPGPLPAPAGNGAPP